MFVRSDSFADFVDRGCSYRWLRFFEQQRSGGASMDAMAGQVDAQNAAARSTRKPRRRRKRRPIRKRPKPRQQRGSRREACRRTRPSGERRLLHRDRRRAAARAQRVESLAWMQAVQHFQADRRPTAQGPRRIHEARSSKPLGIRSWPSRKRTRSFFYDPKANRTATWDSCTSSRSRRNQPAPQHADRSSSQRLPHNRYGRHNVRTLGRKRSAWPPTLMLRFRNVACSRARLIRMEVGCARIRADFPSSFAPRQAPSDERSSPVSAHCVLAIDLRSHRSGE